MFFYLYILFLKNTDNINTYWKFRLKKSFSVRGRLFKTFLDKLNHAIIAYESGIERIQTY